VESLATHWIRTVVLGSPVARALGVELLEADVDSVTVRARKTEDATTVPGITHGGTVATLVDIAGAASSASGVKDDDGASGGVTTHLAVSFLAPATSDLTVRADVIHRTRSTTQSEVRVHDAEQRLVAVGQVTSRILH
jgi:uncharacterized protein (TIGR00369 family)